MPSLETARRIASVKNNGAKTIGQIHKENSDWAMDYTWDSDSQSKTCYIYDYFHDNQPQLNFGMTYENTTKTKIDAKFIVTKYPTVDKGKTEYHLMFRPSQKTVFAEHDELYYFETDYRQKYGNEHFVSLFVDIPDDEGNYRKWLIVGREEGNSFIKYQILKCDFRLMWIETNGAERIKRQMWGVLLGQSSYNAGIYSYYNTTKMENQDRCWLPLNSITEKIWYTSDTNKNMRVLVGALCEHPLSWIVSKVQNTDPRGIQQITFYQSEYNPHTDYINFDTGEMYADYYSSSIEPTDAIDSSPTLSSNYGKISASTATIKVGGSYKILTMSVYDENDIDITDNYSGATFNWTCSIDGMDYTDNADVVTWLSGTTFSKKKIKFYNDRSYLDKVLEIQCKIVNSDETVEAVAQFNLVV